MENPRSRAARVKCRLPGLACPPFRRRRLIGRIVATRSLLTGSGRPGAHRPKTALRAIANFEHISQFSQSARPTSGRPAAFADFPLAHDDNVPTTAFPSRIRDAAPSRLGTPVHPAWLCSIVLLLATGCATSSYRYGRFHPQEPDGVASEPVAVEYGKPHKVLDKLGWLVGLPERVFTLNPKASNHEVSPETVDKLRTYLEENDLGDVLVSVNDYDPKGQWRRLRENDRINPFWRYTAGTMSWLGYTLIPYRVFGGDEYNPFTNCLNVTSDVPALVLAEAAYAKDIHSQSLPGSYGAMSYLPVLSLVRRVRGANDVLAYARVQEDWESEKEAYPILYARIGSTAFEPASDLIPVVGPFVAVGGAVVGQATGRTVTAILEPGRKPASSEKNVEGSAAGKTVAGKSSPSQPAPDEPDNGGVVQAGFEEPAPPRR